MPVEDTAIQLLAPITGFIKTISVLFGGVFGIYLVLLFLRYKEYKRMTGLLEGIRADLRKIGKKQGVKFPKKK